MKEKNKNSDKIVEDEQMGKADDMPLVALSEIYTSRERINLFVINKGKTKLKTRLTETSAVFLFLYLNHLCATNNAFGWGCRAFFNVATHWTIIFFFLT